MRDKAQAPPITVFPNDTIVIHYETIAFEPVDGGGGDAHSNAGPRAERDSSAAAAAGASAGGAIPGAGSLEAR